MLKRLIIGIISTFGLLLAMMFIEVLVLVLFDAPVPRPITQVLLMAFMGLSSAGIVAALELR